MSEFIDQITTSRAPAALGPYSQAIRAGKFLFCSGQLGLDPATGELAGPDAGAQTAQALANLQAVVEAGGSSLEHVVKTTVFMTNLGDFGVMNAEYAKFFTGVPPARSTFQVVALPKGGVVEIEAVALCE